MTGNITFGLYLFATVGMVAFIFGVFRARAVGFSSMTDDLLVAVMACLLIAILFSVGQMVGLVLRALSI